MLNEISLHRLKSQPVAGTKFKTPKDLVSWMGAMQAQDYGMARWAVGVRLPGTTAGRIQQAIDKRGGHPDARLTAYVAFCFRKRCLLALPNHGTAIACNGMFRPVIVYNGQVIGIWKKVPVKNKPVVETEFFPKMKVPESPALRKLVKEASEKVIDFYR